MIIVRSSRRAPVLILLALAAVSWGCDDVLVAGALPEAGNVDVMMGAAVVQSDTGVVVNGHPVIRHPYNGRALWLDRFERFEAGGFPELDYPQTEGYHRSWRVMLTHGHPPEQDGDTVVFRFHDHGHATVAGVAMDKLTDLPHVGPGARVRVENFVRYLLSTHVYVEWMHGGSTTFASAPFHDQMVAGASLEVRTTGSDHATPTAATFAARPLVSLTRLENNGPVDLHSAVPTIDTGHSLVLALDRPLDPERAFVVLVPFWTSGNLNDGARSAFIQPRSATDRLVIPPHVLRQLIENAPDAPRAYRAIMVEFLIEDDVFAGEITGDGPDAGPFSLPFVQRGETAINLYLER